MFFLPDEEALSGREEASEAGAVDGDPSLSPVAEGVMGVTGVVGVFGSAVSDDSFFFRFLLGTSSGIRAVDGVFAEEPDESTGAANAVSLTAGRGGGGGVAGAVFVETGLFRLFFTAASGTTEGDVGDADCSAG